MLPAATCARGTAAGKEGAWNPGSATANTPPALTSTAAARTPSVIDPLRRTAAKRAAVRTDFLSFCKGSLLIRKLPSPLDSSSEGPALQHRPSRVASLDAADQDAGVVAAEAHRVRERDVDLGLARLVR